LKNNINQNSKSSSRPSKYFPASQKIAKISIAKKYFVLFPYLT